MYSANQGKALSEKKTIEDCNKKERATIDVTLRLQSGTKDEEMKKTSAGSIEERQVGRITSEPHSKKSGIEDMKLGGVTVLLKKKLKLIQNDRMKNGTCIKNIRRKSAAISPNTSCEYDGPDGYDDEKIE